MHCNFKTEILQIHPENLPTGSNFQLVLMWPDESFGPIWLWQLDCPITFQGFFSFKSSLSFPNFFYDLFSRLTYVRYSVLIMNMLTWIIYVVKKKVPVLRGQYWCYGTVILGFIEALLIEYYAAMSLCFLICSLQSDATVTFIL